MLRGANVIVAPLYTCILVVTVLVVMTWLTLVRPLWFSWIRLGTLAGYTCLLRVRLRARDVETKLLPCFAVLRVMDVVLMTRMLWFGRLWRVLQVAYSLAKLVLMTIRLVPDWLTIGGVIVGVLG